MDREWFTETSMARRVWNTSVKLVLADYTHSNHQASPPYIPSCLLPICEKAKTINQASCLRFSRVFRDFHFYMEDISHGVVEDLLTYENHRDLGGMICFLAHTDVFRSYRWDSIDNSVFNEGIFHVPVTDCILGLFYWHTFMTLSAKVSANYKEIILCTQFTR